MPDGRMAEVECFAGGVGCLVDRSLKREEILGTVFLVADNTAVACAHSVVLFKDWLQALKVRFPASRQEWGVAEAVFHPRFNLKQAAQWAHRSLGDPLPALALQAQNVVVLKLRRQVERLTPEMVAALNELLSAPRPARSTGLSGSLAELDLPSVIQTITNARKEGVLVLSDERRRARAKIFCRGGKVLFARFGNLTNEAAIYQIVCQQLGGDFYFVSQKEPDWGVGEPIVRPPDMLLLESHRRLDELPALKERLGGDASIFARQKDELDSDGGLGEIYPAAKKLWALLSEGLPSAQLGQLSGLDEFSVYSALSELLRSGQIQAVSAESGVAVAPVQPLVMAPHVPLAPWDEIVSLNVDPVGGAAHLKKGHLLGSLRAGDSWNILHNIDLPAQASGSPLFKEGMVIGIHCGVLPTDPKMHDPGSRLQQLLWIQAVYDCLGKRQDHPLAVDPALRSGCIEVARVPCPRCGSSSLQSARFCKTCGQRLIQEIVFTPPSKPMPVWPVAFGLTAIAFLCAWFVFQSQQTVPAGFGVKGGTAASVLPPMAAPVRVGLAVKVPCLKFLLGSKGELFVANRPALSLSPQVEYMVKKGRLTDPLTRKTVVLPADRKAVVVADDNSFALKGLWYRGALELLNSPQSVTAVNLLPLEDYLKGVVPCLALPGSNPETLKAEAVAARTYAWGHAGARASKGPASEGYDLLPDQRDQLYRGLSAETAQASDAVLKTRGVILLDGAEPRKDTAIKQTTTADLNMSSKTVPAALIERVSGVPELNAVEVVRTDPAGCAVSVRVAGSQGEREVDGKVFARVLELPSSAILVAVNEGGKWLFTCRAPQLKPGVPMSLKGADLLAARGWSYEQILLQYYGRDDGKVRLADIGNLKLSRSSNLSPR